MKREFFNVVDQINPLDTSNAAKSKSKDIHLPSIDVNFGSNRILCAFRLVRGVLFQLSLWFELGPEQH
jgi:hypothetical protein